MQGCTTLRAINRVRRRADGSSVVKLMLSHHNIEHNRLAIQLQVINVGSKENHLEQQYSKTLSIGLLHRSK